MAQGGQTRIFCIGQTEQQLPLAVYIEGDLALCCSFLSSLITLLLCGQIQLFKVETYCSRTGAYCYGVKTYYNQQ